MMNTNHLYLPMFLNGLIVLIAVYLDQQQHGDGAPLRFFVRRIVS